MKYKLISWQDIERNVRLLFEKIINSQKVDVIVGISRGGWVPARILSDLLECVNSKTILASMKIEFYTGLGKTGEYPIITQDVSVSLKDQKVLIVDDLADTGRSLQAAKAYINFKGPKSLKIATLYSKPWSKLTPDYFIETVEEWVVFPHENYEFISLSISDELKNLSQPEQITQLLSWGLDKATIDFYFRHRSLFDSNQKE